MLCFILPIKLGMKLFAYFCDPMIIIPAFYISKKFDYKEKKLQLLILSFLLSLTLEVLITVLSYTYVFNIGGVFLRLIVIFLWLFLVKKDASMGKSLKDNAQEKNNNHHVNEK